MTARLVERPGRWALPPQPPETWVGSAVTLMVITCAAVAVGVPGLVLLPEAGGSTFLLGVCYALGSLAALATSYLLVLQSSVTQDRRLGWVAGGFAMLYVVSVMRAFVPAVPGKIDPGQHLQEAALLSVLWLAVIPVTALSCGLARRSAWLLLLPAAGLATAGVGSWQLELVAGSGAAEQLFRQLCLAIAALTVVAALIWRRSAPRGNRGPWGWVGAALLLLPTVGLLRGLDEGSPITWPTLALEGVVLAVPALGLYVLNARGYLRQSRRWRRLESEVRALRASSALLPGLSITPQDEAGLPARAEVVELLAAAQVQVALQPVLDLRTMEPVGQEALARFGGRIPTDRWFRAAGLHGLGIALEQLTLSAALRQLACLPADQFLAVNTSPASLHDDDVLALLHDADLSRLVVEITEHDAVNDYALTREALARLRDGGARIAVDDVGAGFASLRHVLLLQPDVVKLDTSLTRDVHGSARQQAIVRALVTFADEVGAVVLAEGIEVAEQVGALVDAGVTLGQGWHLGIPVIPQADGSRSPAS